jgi:hypothetical protein
VPRLYALYGARNGPELGVPLLRDCAELDRFLRQLETDAFILKPVAGVHGEGVTRLTRSGAGWQASNGRLLSASEIAQHIPRTGYEQWMLQELITGHLELCELSATSGLQTLRIVTLVDDEGMVEILAARLRLLCSDAAADNFNYGRTGNVIANLTLGDGSIRSAVGGGQGRPEICPVTRHPRTGKELIGYRVPGWEAAAELARQAARAFLPLRTVGWDIAVTSGEPCLIEGNVTWDTLSGEPRMGEIYRLLRRLAMASRGMGGSQ